jgi:peptidoglycan/LPS O-acetylase OafA/YrhL
VSRAASAGDGGYRPALDGIRAVAVLGVLGYHLSHHFPGGFLGVDMFFVLSGYLITSLLVDETLRTGRISLTAFWARRARRLLPALLLLLVVLTVVMAASDATVAQASAFRHDVAATLLYYANWHLIASDQSYFAVLGGVSPLRHTWSLAIEEQFYLVWPLVILAASRWSRAHGRRLAFAMGVGAGASAIAMSILHDHAGPSRAYYGTDTRAHGLLVGATLAMLMVNQRGTAAPAVRKLATVLVPAVAVGIGACFVWLHSDADWYYRGGSLGFEIAVAAGIWSVEVHRYSLIARALALSAVRWTGQISYGLYLWQWPILTWVGDPAVGPDRHDRQLAIVGCSVLAAAVSFYLVEQPIRHGRMPVLRRPMRHLPVVFSIAVIVVGLGSWAATETGPSATGGQATLNAFPTCPGTGPRVDQFSWCSRTTPARPTSPVVGVFGDSTSVTLDSGMTEVARARGWRYVRGGQVGCSMLPLLIGAGLARMRACLQNMPRVIDEIQTRYRPTAWIASDVIGRLFPIYKTASSNPTAPGDPSGDRLIAGALTVVLNHLAAQGATVILLGVVPPVPPVGCVTSGDRASTCNGTLADPATNHINAIYQTVARRFGGRVKYVDIGQFVCPDKGRCPASIDGARTRFDGLHFTNAYSKVLVPQIVARAEQEGVKWR